MKILVEQREHNGEMGMDERKERFNFFGVWFVLIGMAFSLCSISMSCVEIKRQLTAIQTEVSELKEKDADNSDILQRIDIIDEEIADLGDCIFNEVLKEE